MAKIAKAPNPFKAYRHFAIITLVVTALLALFASGEKNEALAVQVEQQEREAQVQRERAERTREPELIRRESGTQSRFAGGDTQKFGQPMQRLGTRNGSALASANSEGATRTGESTVIPGYSRTYLDSLTEEQYQQLLRNVRAAGMLSGEEREQATANLTAGSQRRSGVATPSEGLVN